MHHYHGQDFGKKKKKKWSTWVFEKKKEKKNQIYKKVKKYMKR